MTPPGIIITSARSAKEGFLSCDGASYLRADYPLLFDVIGISFGSADADHFNVPDFRGRLVFGYDATDSDFDTIGKTGGAKTANLAHTHIDASHTHTGTGTTSENGETTYINSSTGTVMAAWNHTHTFSVTTAAGGASGSDSQLSSAISVMNPVLVFNFFIKI